MKQSHPAPAPAPSSSAPGSVSAELVYHEGRFHSGLIISLARDGKIASIEPGGEAELHLAGMALLPGFVNAHSHAFQRALRGRTAHRPTTNAHHFWTWREEMYRLVESLTPDTIFEHSLQAFREMASAGFTAVGEFHYVHNGPSGQRYDDDNVLARRVVDAARQAGLRIALLNVFYERGGMSGEPLSPAQQRFASATVEEFLERTVRLARKLEGDESVTVGIAAHSLRAVSPESLRHLLDWSREVPWPFHIHLSEQVIEIEECQRVYGARPVELMAELGALRKTTTGVHCTHISEREIALLAEADALVCACPTTEADLGDGFLLGEELRAAGVRVCLGTDSQVRIDPFEEMRSVEYHERLRHRRRNVLASAAPDAPADLSVERELLRMGSLWGAESLGLAAGDLAPGRWADMAAVDLSHPILSGWRQDTLAAHLALSADPRIISATFVSGRQIAGKPLS